MRFFPHQSPGRSPHLAIGGQGGSKTQPFQYFSRLIGSDKKIRLGNIGLQFLHVPLGQAARHHDFFPGSAGSDGIQNFLDGFFLGGFNESAGVEQGYRGNIAGAGK